MLHKLFFEILLPQNYTLVDMKIRVGITVMTKEIVLADAIDSDSWSLWPLGDLSQQKESYCDLKEVYLEGLLMVQKSFEWFTD